jgi:hypothetical protein
MPVGITPIVVTPMVTPVVSAMVAPNVSPPPAIGAAHLRLVPVLDRRCCHYSLRLGGWLGWIGLSPPRRGQQPRRREQCQ